MIPHKNLNIIENEIEIVNNSSYKENSIEDCTALFKKQKLNDSSNEKSILNNAHISPSINIENSNNNLSTNCISTSNQFTELMHTQLDHFNVLEDDSSNYNTPQESDIFNISENSNLNYNPLHEYNIFNVSEDNNSDYNTP